MLRLCILVAISCLCAAGETAADLARSIREAGLDPGACYRVRDLNFQKEDIHVYLTDGYLIFSKPVEGVRHSAVFTADVEGGDAEALLFPPTRGERQSLAAFTKSPNLDEHFGAAVMVWSDASGNALLDRVEKDDNNRKALEMGPPLAEKWGPVAANLQTGFEMRIVEDVFGPNPSRGMMFMALTGRELGNFDLVFDPRAREEILAGQLTERNGRSAYNVWTSFAARSARNQKPAPAEPWFAISNYKIDASLDPDLRMKVETRATARIGDRPLRVFPFEISHAMQIDSVRIDGVPAELLFKQSPRGRALATGDNDVFLVVAPAPLAAGSAHEFAFDHQGSVISQAGPDVYFVGARASWYPGGGPDFATYDLTFHYPKRLTLVAPGDRIEDRTTADSRITRWHISTPVRMVGFNLGDYEKVSGATRGVTIEVYGNRHLEEALAPKQIPPPPQTSLIPRRPFTSPQIPEIALTPPAPDPLARLRAVAAEVSSSLNFFSSRFGPPALNTLTVAPIPGTFGQGFPGLVYLSTLSYLDPNQRPPAVRRSNVNQVFFSDLMEAHEVAHQWWGNVVTADASQDQWMMEALSSYSALMWLEKEKGPKAMQDVLDSYRDHLLEKNSAGRTVESAGPITWDGRLDASGIGDAWRAITYEKGAWIFHMLRRHLGDAQFSKMLAELRQRYQFRSVTTEDLLALAKEFVPPGVRPSSIDEFFENWVYSTGIPSLKLKYTVRGAAPRVRLSGTIEQSGVDQDFSAEVPVEIQFAKGAPRTVWVRTSSDPAAFSTMLRQAPLRVTISQAQLAGKR
ncbi:MAG: M1 family metallopeptidase [Bryobacteraceae bacterium]